MVRDKLCRIYEYLVQTQQWDALAVVGGLLDDYFMRIIDNNPRPVMSCWYPGKPLR